VQVTAYGRQTVPDRGVVRSCDPLQTFGGSNHITGMAEPKVVKFCTRVGYINSNNRMTSPTKVRGYGHVTVLKFCRLSWCSASRRLLSDSWATCISRSTIQFVRDSNCNTVQISMWHGGVMCFTKWRLVLSCFIRFRVSAFYTYISHWTDIGPAHWTDINLSALGSGVSWIPARKERKNEHTLATSCRRVLNIWLRASLRASDPCWSSFSFEGLKFTQPSVTTYQ